MEGREKIKQLLKEGKINSDQAVLLIRALRESEGRRERIFKQVLTQRKKREKDRLGFLGVWFLLVLCLVLVTAFAGARGGFERDAQKALVDFHEATVSIEEGKYATAIAAIQKGIRKAPRFGLGYTLLGAASQLLYEETKDPSLKNEAREAYRKALELKETFSMRQRAQALAVFFACLLLLLIAGAVSAIFLLIYNRLIRNEERVNEAWAQILTSYDQKANLIPVLLEVVKAYAAHEKEILGQVTETRSDAAQTLEAAEVESSTQRHVQEVDASQSTLEGSLRRLYAAVENYPDLKAHMNFLTVQEQLADTENTIVQARENYNQKVRQYNAQLRYFPANAVAQAFGFGPKGYFEGQGTSHV
ncbi:MAG: LemA family protein [Candidatus Omnitrophota bacterium]